MKRSPEQNRRFHTLIGRLGYNADQKQQLVSNFTDGRESSSSEMTYQEMQDLINHLQKGTKSDDNNHLRRKIFSIAHDLGWELGSGKVNKERLENFLVRRGKYKKPLMSLSRTELIDTITQLEQLQRKKYEKD